MLWISAISPPHIRHNRARAPHISHGQFDAMAMGMVNALYGMECTAWDALYGMHCMGQAMGMVSSMRWPWAWSGLKCGSARPPTEETRETRRDADSPISAYP